MRRRLPRTMLNPTAARYYNSKHIAKSKKVNRFRKNEAAIHGIIGILPQTKSECRSGGRSHAE